MKSIIKTVVKNLQTKTGIDVDIYDVLGARLASTEGIKKSYTVYNSLPNYCDGQYVDKSADMTFFLIAGGYYTYIGAIEGSSAVSKNYAYMLSTLIENALQHSDMNLSRSDNYKAILLGEATKEQISRFITKFSLPNQPCYVLSIHVPRDKQGEVLSLMNQFSQGLDEVIIVDENNLSYVKFIENDEDYESSLSFAETLHSSITNELNVKCTVGVGTSVSEVMDLQRSYEEAISAIRMSHLVSGKEGVYSYKEYILLKIMEDMPKAKLRQYMDSLIDTGSSEILSDNAIMVTGEEFLNTSLNISETSKNLYMHRNTLVYRLDKIEKGMGLNIRRFSDAVTFRIITMIYKLLKK